MLTSATTQPQGIILLLMHHAGIPITTSLFGKTTKHCTINSHTDSLILAPSQQMNGSPVPLLKHINFRQYSTSDAGQIISILQHCCISRSPPSILQERMETPGKQEFLHSFHSRSLSLSADCRNSGPWYSINEDTYFYLGSVLCVRAPWTFGYACISICSH